MTSPWRVKYDGVCSRCGTALKAGSIAVYERSTRTIHCVDCSSAAAPPDRLVAEPSSLDPGIAGASARKEYERRRSAREERIRGRLGDRLGGVVLALSTEPQSTRAWATGAKGEEKLARALEDIEGLRVLHDRRVPGTRGNIDHLAVARAGVFVIDAKRYEGLIRIRDRGTLFRRDDRLYVGRRDCSALADGLAWQVEAVTSALRRAGSEPLPPVTPVLCFVDGEWPLLSPPRSFRAVRVEGARSIRRLLASDGPLGTVQIDGLARTLSDALPSKEPA